MTGYAFNPSTQEFEVSLIHISEYRPGGRLHSEALSQTNKQGESQGMAQWNTYLLLTNQNKQIKTGISICAAYQGAAVKMTRR